MRSAWGSAWQHLHSGQILRANEEQASAVSNVRSTGSIAASWAVAPSDQSLWLLRTDGEGHENSCRAREGSTGYGAGLQA